MNDFRNSKISHLCTLRPMNQMKRQLAVLLPPIIALIIAWMNPMGWPANVSYTLAIMVWMLSWWLMETVPRSEERL
jgi:hypothetical protein